MPVSAGERHKSLNKATAGNAGRQTGGGQVTQAGEVAVSNRILVMGTLEKFAAHITQKSTINLIFVKILSRPNQISARHLA